MCACVIRIIKRYKLNCIKLIIVMSACIMRIIKRYKLNYKNVRIYIKIKNTPN